MLGNDSVNLLPRKVPTGIQDKLFPTLAVMRRFQGDPKQRLMFDLIFLHRARGGTDESAFTHRHVQFPNFHKFMAFDELLVGFFQLCNTHAFKHPSPTSKFKCWI